MRATMIDNYDSFTFNLVQYMQMLGVEVVTIRNDVQSADKIIADAPDLIVMSPGPGNPNNAGVCLDLVQTWLKNGCSIPMLGVCLGHQALCQALGANIVRSDLPMHGKVSQISHNSSGLFAGIDIPIDVTRYHSLTVDPESVPTELNIDAQGKDGTVMAVSMIDRPLFGLQFHPEAVLTTTGMKMLENFVSQGQ